MASSRVSRRPVTRRRSSLHSSGTLLALGKKYSVFVASTFLPEVRVEFAEAFDLVFSENAADPHAELANRVSAGEVFDGVLFSLDVEMGAPQIAELPEGISFLATYSVGTDHVDLEAARGRGLAVFNTPGVLADSVAENAIFLMLGAARRATESVALIRGGEWPGWNPTQLVGVQLSGRTLGVIGMGDIGQRIASRAAALGMEILYHNRRPLPAEHPLSDGYRKTPMALIAESDVLMLACPSTDETRGLVNSELLDSARPELLVVNIARGDVVSDDALIAALSSGRIKGAGLDVFAGEPKVDERYFDLPNVFMMPHIGSSTIEARLGMGRILIEGIAIWTRGESPPNRVV